MGIPLLILAQRFAQFKHSRHSSTGAKHSSTGAYHHLPDMKRTEPLDIFDGSFKNNGEAKPVMIVTVEEGPDENFKYTKTIACAIDYFLSQELDVFFLATNAPVEVHLIE